MTEDQYEPTKAEVLAGLITRQARTSIVTATVQRSHRFPLHLMVQIENMAELAGSPVSLIINELLECGLEAVRKELPEHVAEKIAVVSKEQINRPTKTTKLDSAQSKKK